MQAEGCGFESRRFHQTGAIAQLGERSNRTAEVGSSSLPGSTNPLERTFQMVRPFGSENREVTDPDAILFRAFLVQFNISQRRFAKRMGVSHSTVSNWAVGYHPLPGWLKAYMRVLPLLQPDQIKNELANVSRYRRRHNYPKRSHDAQSPGNTTETPGSPSRHPERSPLPSERGRQLPEQI